MPADRERHVTLVGLEVIDQASYARYRADMAPTLEVYGGAFDQDFAIAETLKGDRRINRVFTLSFPDRHQRERFFADGTYRAVRKRFFEPAVGLTLLLGELTRGSRLAAYPTPDAP